LTQSWQNRLSSQHDEMLFIIIHQASELWLKLAGHEVEAAIGNVKEDDYRHAFKVIARVKLIFNQLVNSWNILSTMTPVDYLTFREMLGPASGFQSYAYRKLEFLLGNKNAALVEVHRHDDKVYDELSAVITAPSLYDVVITKLADSGFDIDAEKLERDFSQPYEPNESVQNAWLEIYFKHMLTVQRIIGNRKGTGGSSGVPFLKKALETSFFPELFSIRTDL